MPLRIRLITVFLLFSSLSPVLSQNFLGISCSDYSGVNRVFINPSTIITTKVNADFLLAGGNLFLQNNYLYIPGEDYSFAKLLRQDLPSYEPDGRNFLDNYVPGIKHAYLSGRLTGPSLMLNFGRHAFSLHHSVRTMTSIDGLPVDIAKFSLEGLQYEPQHNIRYVHSRQLSIGSVSLYGLGFSYATNIYQQNDEIFTAGATLKHNMAYHGFTLSAYSGDYMVPHSDTLFIYFVDANGGIALPLDYENNDFLGFSQPFRGRGISLDFGLSYTRTLQVANDKRFGKRCAYPYEDYRFRVGLSVMDIGKINFTHEAQWLSVDNVTAEWQNINEVQFENVNQLLTEFSEVFYGNSTEIFEDNRFSLFLPSIISLQVDYNFQNNLLLNAVWINNLAIGEHRIGHPSVIALIPRYAVDLYEIALPLSLYRYREPRIGLSLRFSYFSAGTEKLGGFFGFSDFDGMDFYFSINYFRLKGKCPRKDRDLFKCPRFN